MSTPSSSRGSGVGGSAVGLTPHQEAGLPVDDLAVAPSRGAVQPDPERARVRDDTGPVTRHRIDARLAVVDRSARCLQYPITVPEVEHVDLVP